MSKQGGKSSFFGRIFGGKSHKEHHDGPERNRAEVTFANENRYHQSRMNQTFGVDENDIHDEKGFLKATAAYHTGKSSKASRGARSYHGMSGAKYANDSSDSDAHTANNSFRSTFNATEASKRYFRRSSKRHKKVVRPAYEDYDEQSSSNASCHALQPIDMNTQHNGRMVPSSLPDYYRQPNRQYEETRTMMLEQKLLESSQKIKDYVNKYRREKARANELQMQLNEMSKRSVMESQMVYEQSKQIQKLQEEIERLRNSYMPAVFNTTHSFQSQFRNITPQTHLFSNYQMTPSDFHNMAPTRTVSEADNDSAFQLKNFRDEGAPEQMISESSFPPSITEGTEIARTSKDDSFLTNTLILSDTAVQSDPVPSLIGRDEGYATSETGKPINRNFYRRSRHFGTATVPKKIRRTNSWN